MITELRLGNFKAFAETQKIPIKPLTLIFGPNSAGKSSLIHGIALANEAMKTGDLDVYRTTVGGEAIDLGGFRQYVHRRNKDLNVEWAIELDVSKLSGRIAELLAPVKSITLSIIFGLYEFEGKKLFKIFENKIDKNASPATKEILRNVINIPSIRSCEITADGKFILRASIREARRYRVDRLESDHPVLREIFKAIVQSYTTSTTILDNDYESFEEAISDLLSELTIKFDRFLPRFLLKNGTQQRIQASMLVPVSKVNRKEILAEATKTFLPIILNELIQGLSETIETEIRRFQYLGPLRSYPPRHIAFAQHEDMNWYAGGGYAWDVVRKNFVVRNKVNDWLGDKGKLSTPYELTLRHLLTIDDLDAVYTKVVEGIESTFTAPYMDTTAFTQGNLFEEIYEIIGKLKESEASISDIQELSLIDKRTNTVVSHRDVGIGISQVLPVLVGAYASKEKIIAIEQPEIHLHPALQAELGDVFIESALGENKNTYILETHSEHLILRLLRRIRETSNNELPEGQRPVKPNDVTVIYAEPTDKGTVLKELRITEDGEFADKWPGGFFAERTKELF